MATLSTTAWVLHDLGLAAGFGGNLFGQLALNPAVQSVESKRERGMVVHVAWDRYKIVNAVSLAAMASTWMFGRSFISGKSIGKDARGLVLAKDILVLGAVGTGIASMIIGSQLAREGNGAPVIETGNEPAPETPPRIARLQRIEHVVGAANVGFNAAVMAVTTVLAMKSGKSGAWSFLSRLLP